MMLLVLMGLASVASAAADEGPTPRMSLTDMASQLISRSATNSQVLSLNLTNLVILLLLKGLLYGATMWGGGHHQQGGHSSYKGRSESGDPLISETEAMLFTTYLFGFTQDDFSCLYRVACQDPTKAKQYLAASKLLLKTAKTMKDVVPYNEKYEKIVYNTQDAINFGIKYGSCIQRFPCKREEQEAKT